MPLILKGFTDEQAKFVQFAYEKSFRPSQRRRKLFVELRLCNPKDLQDSSNKAELIAEIKPRHYTIWIIKNCGDLFKTIAHELIHIRHYEFQNFCLFQDDKGQATFATWLNKRLNVRNMNYWEYPWEKEAYGESFCVYNLWLEQEDK